MRDEGRPYRGFLYVGLMLTEEGPKVIEFNARLGDPETQVILPRIDQDLLPLLRDAARGSLGSSTVRVTPRPHVGVVLASAGYPDDAESGKRIDGLDDVRGMRDVVVFHAASAARSDGIVTAGGPRPDGRRRRDGYGGGPHEGVPRRPPGFDSTGCTIGETSASRRSATEIGWRLGAGDWRP